MISVQQTKDAEFFSLVHSVLESERQRDLKERRNGRRHPYRCLQLIAPTRGDSLPEKSEFRRVQCVDLSPSGFSYLADEPPASAELVAVLGTEPLIRVMAEVVRHQPVLHDGRSVYRVACRFSGRVVDIDGGGGVWP